MHPFCSSCSIQTMSWENLSFWTLGYGGWLGVCILPILWSLPVPKTIKFVLSFLSPAACAFGMTTVFSLLYLFSLFLYSVGKVMIHPQFVQSCMGIVCVTLACIVFHFANYGKVTIEVKKAEAESEGEDEGAEESEEWGGEDSEEGTEGEESEVAEESEGTEGEESEGAEGVEEDVGNDWKNEANFAGLAEAAPLSE